MQPPIDQQLKTHTRALRAIARDLVGEHADDLLQDVALQALVAPPRRAGPVGGWLAAVLRRLASKHRRSEHRRVRREMISARPEAVPPPEVDLQTRETFRRLTDAVLALPEPYQDVVLRRYLQEQPPATIAAATAVPLATVKSRLQRGLALLRDQFERDGSDWRAALLTTFVPRGPHVNVTSSGDATTGALVLGSGVKFAYSGAAALLLVAATLWLVSQPGGTVPVQGSGEPRAVAAVAGGGNRDAEAAATPARREVTDALKSPARVMGRCVDRAGQPLAGCTAHLTAIESGGDEPIVDLQTLTASDGTFTLAGPRTDHLNFQLEVTGRRRVGAKPKYFTLIAGQTLALGDIRLWSGCEVTGQVLDALGSAVAGATVKLLRDGPALDDCECGPLHRVEATTNADGMFQMPACLPGVHCVQVENQLVLAPATVAIDSSEATHVVVIRIEVPSRLPSVDGIVVDSRGEPIVGARVEGWGGGLHAWLRSDRNGRFIVRRNQPAESESIQVVAQLHGSECAMASSVAWGTHDLQLLLREPLTLAVEVVDADTREPVTEFAVRCIAVDGGPVRRTYPWFEQRASGRHPGGRLEIPGMHHGEYELCVEPSDGAHAASTIVRVAVTDPGPVLVRIALSRTATATLQLVTPSGKRVAGCEAELCQQTATAVTLRSSCVPVARWDSYNVPEKSLLLATVTTDASGNATLHGPRNCDLSLRILGPGCQLEVIDHVRLDGMPLRVEVRPGASLLVRLEPVPVIDQLEALGDAKSARPARPGLRLSRTDEHGLDCIPLLDLPPRLVRADGTVCFEGVPPGTWNATLHWLQDSRYEQESLHSVSLAEGAASELRCDIATLQVATLRGRISLDGTPCANQRIQIEIDLGRRVDGRVVRDSQYATTDGDGNFVYRGRGGRYRVLLELRNAGDELLSVPNDILVAPGSTMTQDFVVTTGTCTLRIVDGDGMPVGGVVGMLMRRNDGYCARNLTTSRADGTIPAGVCESGTFKLTIKSRSQVHQYEAPDIDLGTIEIRAGEHTERDVKLPPEYFR